MIQRHGVIVAADNGRLSSFSEPPEGDGDEDESSDGDGESASGEGDVVGESPDGDGESASVKVTWSKSHPTATVNQRLVKVT